MVYDIQDYRVFGLCPSSGIIKNRRTQSFGEPDPTEILNRRHIVSIAFPVNVADATLAKQADASRTNPRT
jgi:hypothetical protein